MEDSEASLPGRVIVKYSARVGKEAARLSSYSMSSATWEWMRKANSNLLKKSLIDALHPCITLGDFSICPPLEGLFKEHQLYHMCIANYN